MIEYIEGYVDKFDTNSSGLMEVWLTNNTKLSTENTNVVARITYDYIDKEWADYLCLFAVKNKSYIVDYMSF